MSGDQKYVCKLCRAGPFALSVLAQHDCVTNPDMIHYSIGPGIRQCGAAVGKESFTGTGVDCPTCKAYLNRKAIRQ